MVETVKDLQGLHVNVPPGNGMVGPGDDVRLRRPRDFGRHMEIIVKFSKFFNPLIPIIVKESPKWGRTGEKTAGTGELLTIAVTPDIANLGED
jgi:hypothetical protein